MDLNTTVNREIKLNIGMIQKRLDESDERGKRAVQQQIKEI